jgi:hypothetical protein
VDINNSTVVNFQGIIIPSGFPAPLIQGLSPDFCARYKSMYYYYYFDSVNFTELKQLTEMVLQPKDRKYEEKTAAEGNDIQEIN